VAVEAGCSVPFWQGVQARLPLAGEKEPGEQGAHRKYVGLRYG